MIEFLCKKNKKHMVLVGSLILPHPPVMVPSVGGEKGLKPIQKTVQAMIEAGELVASWKTDTVVIITPHGSCYPDAVSIRMPEEGKLSGDLGMFGSEDGLSLESDNDFADKIIDAATDGGVKTIAIDEGNLDHGVLAPMHYIDKALDGDYKMVSMNISFAGPRVHYEFGRLLNKLFVQDERRVLFVASGDLSHSLKEGAPAGYTKEGKEFDEKLVELIKEGKTDEILDFDPFWVDQAKECGFRSVCTALGVVEKYKVHSYEGPYGVGYLVASYCVE